MDKKEEKFIFEGEEILYVGSEDGPMDKKSILPLLKSEPHRYINELIDKEISKVVYIDDDGNPLDHVPTIYIHGDHGMTQEDFDKYIPALDRYIKVGFHFIVTDECDFDIWVQTYLHEHNVKDVVIYCTSDVPTNNVGNFKVCGGLKTLGQLSAAINSVSDKTLYISRNEY